MSQANIRSALETALAGMSPAIATAYENVSFTPPAPSTPYQKAFVMFAEPDNSEFGSGSRQQGVFQVSLMYPIQQGDATARARAAMLESVFKRGSSFVKSGITVTVTRTPHAGQGTVDGDRWHVPVKIQFITGVIL